jgi:hypothetical protein
MEAFVSIVLLVIAMFVYAGFTAVTEKLDEIIERLTPPRHVHNGELSVGQRPPWPFGQDPGTDPTGGQWTEQSYRQGFTTYFDACTPEHAPPCALPGLIGKCR